VVAAAAAAAVTDRVGLGWRGELAAGIFEHIDRIDVLEVIAEDWLHAPRREAAALAELGRTRPLTLHGVTLGLAGSEPVAAWRLDRMARLVAQVQPESWSEHLAFVRAGGVEIGHLAAPPRTAATVDAAVANIQHAARVVGTMPRLENIASLIDPPASSMGEAAWVRAIVDQAGAGLLLDLHNLLANALNFGLEPLALLHAMPLERVVTVHLAGGRWIAPAGLRARLLDDHLHNVPETVFALLEGLARAVPQPLTVLLERDGEYPQFGALLAQLDRARAALARGRAARRLPEPVAA
jgi:uncharacterized protein (UPF0276 family)